MGKIAQEVVNLFVAFLAMVVFGCLIFGVFTCAVDTSNGGYSRGESKIISVLCTCLIAFVGMGTLFYIKISRRS